MSLPGNNRALMGGATDVGAVREENEDSYGLWGPEAGDWDVLIAVADGVGGHEHGKQASELALSAFFGALSAGPVGQGDSAIRKAVDTAIRAANDAVYSAFTGTGTSRPGSTFTCVLVKDQKCYVGHVGDSRAYMVHGQQIFQLSTDHTWVQLQVESGTMTPEEAAVSPYRNQVLKVLGVEPQVEADVVVRTVAPGDLFIVCSDGVTEHVSDGQLLEQSTQAMSAENLAQTLVALAVAQGGSDNATAVVAGLPGAAAHEDTVRKPETVEMPLVQERPASPVGAPLAPPTRPLPTPAPTAGRPRPRGSHRRNLKTVLAIVLAAIIVLLGATMLAGRHRGKHPSTKATPSSAAATKTASPANTAAPVSVDGPVASRRQTLQVPGAQNVVFSHSGDKVVVMSRDAENRVWLNCLRVDTAQAVFPPIDNGSVELNSMNAVFNKDDSLIFYQGHSTDGQRNGPRAVDAATGEEKWWRSKDKNTTGGLAVSPNGEWLAAADASAVAQSPESGRIYHASSGDRAEKLPAIAGGYARFVFSPRNAYVGAATGEGVLIISVDNGRPKYAPASIISPAGMWNCETGLAVATQPEQERQLLVLDWRSGETVDTHPAPGLVAVSPSLKWYACSDQTTGLTLRSLEDGKVLQTLQAAAGGRGSLTLSDDGKSLALWQGGEVTIFSIDSAYQ